ncbi:Hypothetical protein D9617_6g096030 [Elsinoe fawcettii]|nr:Hypothetical protein D9617_6g096030 [Elsinoe fawcettii]
MANSAVPAPVSAPTAAVAPAGELVIVEEIEHHSLNSQGIWAEKRGLDQTAFAKFEPDNATGIHIFFMPSVKEITEKSPKWSNLSSILSKKYQTPWNFFEFLGWNHNGYYTGALTGQGENELKHVSSTRFLIKHIKTDKAAKSDSQSKDVTQAGVVGHRRGTMHSRRTKRSETNRPVDIGPKRTDILDIKTEFSWDFIGYHVIWHKKAGKTSLILLCFDFSGGEEKAEGLKLLTRMRHYLTDQQKASIDVHVADDPFRIHTLLLREVLRIIDQTVWDFREPLKSLEERYRPVESPSKSGTTSGATTPLAGVPSQQPSQQANSTAPKSPGQSSKKHGKTGSKKTPTDDRDQLQKEIEHKTEVYYHLLGLLRHLQHGVETMSAASRALVRMEKDCSNFFLPSIDDPDTMGRRIMTEPTLEELRYSMGLLENLHERARSNEKRLNNQLAKVFHEVDLESVAISRSVLDEISANDREVTEFLTRLTVIFLPATFTATFFGMNFFELASWPIWLYFVVTVPVTLLCFTLGLGLSGLGSWHILLRGRMPASKRKQTDEENSQ